MGIVFSPSCSSLVANQLQFICHVHLFLAITACAPLPFLLLCVNDAQGGRISVRMVHKFEHHMRVSILHCA